MSKNIQQPLKKKKPTAKRTKKRLRSRPISLIWLFTSVLAIVLIGYLVNQRLDNDLFLLQEEYGFLNKQKDGLTTKILELDSQIKLSENDDFIENEARTKYGFLRDGEIRFVITNPEVLWGPEGPPPEYQNEQK